MTSRKQANEHRNLDTTNTTAEPRVFKAVSLQKSAGHPTNDINFQNARKSRNDSPGLPSELMRRCQLALTNCTKVLRMFPVVRVLSCDVPLESMLTNH
jgi:hypothetical protein